jgi:dTMP kinase
VTAASGADEQKRGRFITFEGIDGAGKSTHIDTVDARARARGATTLRTREPGGTPLGEALRELLLHRSMTPETETLLMFAARAEHVTQVIEPALAAGTWVLCDRFTDATYAYQAGGRGMNKSRVAELERWVHSHLQPDLTILFDIAPEIAAERLGRARNADRFELEPAAFFSAVRAMYLERARLHATRFFVVDSSQAPDVVRAQLEDLLDRWNG